MNRSEEMAKAGAHDFVSRAGLRVGTWIVALLDALAASRRHQNDYAALASKSDHELRDIGLTRQDVDRVFGQKRPFSSYHDLR